ERYWLNILKTYLNGHRKLYFKSLKMLIHVVLRVVILQPCLRKEGQLQGGHTMEGILNEQKPVISKHQKPISNTNTQTLLKYLNTINKDIWRMLREKTMKPKVTNWNMKVFYFLIY